MQKTKSNLLKTLQSHTVLVALNKDTKFMKEVGGNGANKTAKYLIFHK